MKTMLKFTLMLFLSFSAVTVNAQDIGALLTQIVNGIKPEAFTSKFSKNMDDWKGKAAKLDANDLTAVTSQISGLINGLKGDAFVKGGQKDLLNSLASVANMGDVGKVLESMVSNLNPSMLTSELATGRDALKSQLSTLGN